MLKRQGDILLELVQLEAIPVKGQIYKIEDGVIAKGETTGHAHKLNGGELKQVASDGTMYALVPDGGTVTHEEHGKIELEPGVWQIHRQTEYVSPSEETTVYD